MSCKKNFQLEYAYEAHKPGVKDRIIDMAINGSGVRDTMRVLKVGINTVIRHLKTHAKGNEPVRRNHRYRNPLRSR